MTAKQEPKRRVGDESRQMPYKPPPTPAPIPPLQSPPPPSHHPSLPSIPALPPPSRHSGRKRRSCSHPAALSPLLFSPRYRDEHCASLPQKPRHREERRARPIADDAENSRACLHLAAGLSLHERQDGGRHAKGGRDEGPHGDGKWARWSLWLRLARLGVLSLLRLLMWVEACPCRRDSDGWEVASRGHL